MATTKPRKLSKRSKEQKELQLAVSALKGAEHNPVAWGAVINFIAPIVAGWAVRTGLSYVSRKTGKRINPSTRDAAAQHARELTGELVSKIR